MGNRFARVTSEMLMRHMELAIKHHKTGKLGKSALETLYLYLCILCHSWATGILEMPLKDLCKLYGLEYHNSTRRLKTLRKKGWVEDTKKYIRPLLIHRPGDKNLFPTGDSKSVIVTSADEGKSVTVTPDKQAKSVTVTPKKCNSYTEIKEKSVTVTPENNGTSIPASNYGDSKTLLNLKTDLDPTTSSSSSEKNLSKFLPEECLRYVEIRIERGDKLETPHKFAKWLHQSGEMDAFIEATLYPSEQSVTTLPPVEYADEEFFDELPPAEPLSDDEKQSSLVLLRSMLRESSIENLETFSVNFTRDDWAWLKGELQNAG